MTRYIGNPKFAGVAYLSEDDSKVILIKLIPIKLFLEYYKERESTEDRVSTLIKDFKGDKRKQYDYDLKTFYRTFLEQQKLAK